MKYQLKIGDRLIIPVGAAGDAQELLKLTRRPETEFEEQRLGSVRFVPLVGSGSKLGGRRKTIVIVPSSGVSQRKMLADLIAEAAELLPDSKILPLARCRPLRRQVVLLGEASHGTSEFY